MSDDQPERPTCGAPTSTGAPCLAWPSKGGKRCAAHADVDDTPEIAEAARFGRSFVRSAPVAQRAIAEALHDKGLLDIRRPVAIQQVILQQAPLVPDDDLVIAFARRASKWRPNPKANQTWEDQPEPTEAELTLARIALLREMSRLSESYTDAVTRAAKVAQVSELLEKLIVPMFAELGLEITELAERFVAADRREQFGQEFRSRIRRIYASIIDGTRDNS